MRLQWEAERWFKIREKLSPRESQLQFALTSDGVEFSAELLAIRSSVAYPYFCVKFQGLPPTPALHIHVQMMKLFYLLC